MKVTESKSIKRQGNSCLDVLFSSFKSNDLSVVEILPYKRITKEEYLVDKENEYQVFLKVKTADLVNMNDSDLSRIISQLTSICRVYMEPMKILSMTNSTETISQQLYWKKKINKYRKILISKNSSEIEIKRYEVMLKLAIDNLRRVTWVEENLSELTFFIVVYAKNKKEIEKRVKDMIRFGGKQFNFKKVSRKNLEKILFRLNNMNTEL